MRSLEEDWLDRSIDILVDLEEVNKVNTKRFPVHPRNKGLQDNQD